MIGKLERLRRFYKRKADGYFLYKSENFKLNDLRYLTDFDGSTGLFFQTKEKNYLFVDGRYFEKAKINKKENLELVLLKKGWEKELNKIVKKEKIKKIIIEPYQSFSLVEFLKKKIKAKIIISKKPIVLTIRKNKDIEEIEILRKAQEITDKIFLDLLNFIKPGKQTEKEIAFKIYELALKKYNCEGLSFEPIVASGSNSSIPHYRSGDKIIENNQPLLLDFGVIYKGYVSDMTRTLWIGNKIDQDFKKAYRVVLEAQKRAIERCRFENKIKAKDVDKIARDYIENHGYKGKFLHSTGHGVGMDVHEEPVLGPYSKDYLKGSEVVTIEPGIYLEGRFGIRIEDTVLTKDGENFTKAPKELINL